jgi:molecular chaperone GrpE
MDPKEKENLDHEQSDEPTAETADMADAEAAEELAAADEESNSVAPTSDEVIGSLTDELKELEDRHLRLVAEFDNFRKRTIRERAQQTERAQAELVKLLLESLDDLARVSHMSSGEHKAAAILEGVQLVESKLLRALEAAGLTAIEAVGQPFDPQLHDALVTVSTDEPDQDDVVSQEIARGYLFKDALLRPSLVEVKKYRPAAGADQ